MRYYPAMHVIILTMIAAVLLAGCSAQSVGRGRPQPLRVMSFNIRLSAVNDGVNSWPNRKELYLQTVRDFAPDLLGTQEVIHDQFEALVAGLPEMHAIGVGRDDGVNKGERSALLVRKSRFDVLDSGTFWLSETPEVIGSKSWDAAITRICTWARLKDRMTGRELLCANAHFDHKGELARENSAKLLAKRLPELAAGAPMILMGDFNATEDSPAYRALVGSQFSDSYRVVRPERSPEETTFHAFKGTTTGSRIDWILHTPELQAIDAQILRSPARDGVYPSDHYPVTATLAWSGD